MSVSNDYYVDIVMCIDGTSSMSAIIDEIKKQVVSFGPKCTIAMKKHGHEVIQLRIKLIVFRDYGCDDEPMVESQFYMVPSQDDKLMAFLDSIEAKGGMEETDGNKHSPANALEAIALALKSDWTTAGSRQRHVIVVYTYSPALPLGERSGAAAYPSGLPLSLAALGAWWEGTDQSLGSTYKPKSGRLVVFAPNVSPWTDLQTWNRYWPAFCKDLDPEVIRDSLDLLWWGYGLNY